MGAISPTTKAYASDRYGNLTTAWDKTSASITYAYDEASRLTGITPQTGSAATLTPDALDRSKSRVVGSTTDTYGYAGPSTTSYETGSTTKTDALLDVDGSRLAVKTGSTLSWVIFDLHGSIVALCPAGSSSLSDAYRYDAWGQAIGTNPGSATNPWRYRGLLDLSPDANPILSMGARFYSPSLGSFTQEDSVQGQAANPLSMNRYLYAEADPETLIDPDGHAVMTTATLCSRFEDYCSAPSTRSATSPSATPKLVFNKDSANYKQAKVSAPASASPSVAAARMNVANWGVGCSWCGDFSFRTGGSSRSQAIDALHAQEAAFTGQSPNIKGVLLGISAFTGFGALVFTVAGAAGIASGIGLPLGISAEAAGVGLSAVSSATALLGAEDDCDAHRMAECVVGVAGAVTALIGVGSGFLRTSGLASDATVWALKTQADMIGTGAALAGSLDELHRAWRGP